MFVPGNWHQFTQKSEKVDTKKQQIAKLRKLFVFCNIHTSLPSWKEMGGHESTKNLYQN